MPTNCLLVVTNVQLIGTHVTRGHNTDDSLMVVTAWMAIL